MNRGRVPFNDLSRIHSVLTQDFKNALSGAINDNDFVLGNALAEFEYSYAQSEGFGFCVGVDNGTNAIELALRALGVSEGDEVIIPAMTFIATVFAVQRLGAHPVLVDTMFDSPHLDPSRIEEAISPKTKVIVYVTLHGSAPSLASVSKLAKSHGLYVLVDGAQSQGLCVNGKPISFYADIMTTSFYPGKNLGSLGEGGAVLSNNSSINKRLKIMRDWGAEVKYEHDYWGGNFRLHSLQARFLRIKLTHLPTWIARRREIALYYDSKLNPDFIRTFSTRKENVFHIYEILARSRDSLIKYLNKRGVQSSIHYPRVVCDNSQYSHLCPKWPIDNARFFASSTLSIPLFPGMFDWEIYEVIDALNSYLIEN